MWILKFNVAYGIVYDKRWTLEIQVFHHILLDDSSRFITRWNVFDDTASENAVSVLKKAVADHGKPTSLITDHGIVLRSRCTRKKDVAKFWKYLIVNDMQHLLDHIRHPQTNDRIERLFEEFNHKIQHYFNIKDFVN